ncbi:hypothetical protein TNCV_4615701 [Trichonephila clavipes]|nr:hypothetical protein TNCV_4615701 [Trichonephila clavipes]
MKVDVQSVHRAFRGSLKPSVERMTAPVTASRCSPKYKQHADKQQSSFVSHYDSKTNSLSFLHGKKFQQCEIW